MADVSERAVEPDAVETPGKEGAGDSLELVVYRAEPGSEIETNIDDIVERVREMLPEFRAWDIRDGDGYRDAKRARAALRRVRKQINDRKVEIRRAYMRALEPFDEKVKGALGPLDEADAALKGSIADYEATLRGRRLSQLRERYEEAAGDLAELVPFDAVMERRGDPKWLNQSYNDWKATRELESLVARISDEWRGVEELATDDDERDRYLAYYVESLDVATAMLRAQQDRSRREEIRRQREDRERWEAEQAAGAASAHPLAEDIARASAEAARAEMEAARAESESKQNPKAKRRWRVVVDMDIEATREEAMSIARALKSCGLTGTIKPIREG